MIQPICENLPKPNSSNKHNPSKNFHKFTHTRKVCIMCTSNIFLKYFELRNKVENSKYDISNTKKTSLNKSSVQKLIITRNVRRANALKFYVFDLNEISWILLKRNIFYSLRSEVKSTFTYLFNGWKLFYVVLCVKNYKIKIGYLKYPGRLILNDKKMTFF